MGVWDVRSQSHKPPHSCRDFCFCSHTCHWCKAQHLESFVMFFSLSNCMSSSPPYHHQLSPHGISTTPQCQCFDESLANIGKSYHFHREWKVGNIVKSCHFWGKSHSPWVHDMTSKFWQSSWNYLILNHHTVLPNININKSGSRNIFQENKGS